MNSEQIVNDFCSAWVNGDLEAIMAAFAEDAVYHNIPMQPCEGKTAIREFIQGFLSGAESGGINFDIKHQVASGNIVFNERIDSFKMGGKEIAAPVCGVFEIDADGKIKAWRDYFDMGQFQGN